MVLIISNLVFYRVAIRIMFTFEKRCKDTKKNNTNQINFTIMEEFLTNHLTTLLNSVAIILNSITICLMQKYM